ncbi:hypothetical protein DY000_02023268 [Brassica cretica]|uniref:Uncharacterized protein n=1 Tax=Brassica cretica TaxID=69181 RepID=A0ABQ7E7U6_BRACR|nr:hypothetical protein DY000_02023268 [Brassica cretica]
MKSSKYPEEFPKKFRGNTKLGRVQGSSELEDPLQPSTSGNLSAAEDLAGVGLVVDLTGFGEEAVVHVEDEPVIGEFHQDPDSDSSGDDDSETDYH